MKYLITGINGFVGEHLAGFLLKKKAIITGTVYGPVNTPFFVSSGVKIFPCSLSLPSDITRIIKKTKPDAVVHLAGQSYVPFSWRDPAETFKVNVLGTIHLLDAVKNHSPKTRILAIGSGDEYAPNKSGKPLKEAYPLFPQNPYALSKMCADLISLQIASLHNLDVVVARSFAHIGPGQSPNFVVADFCRQIALIEKGRQPAVIKTGDLNVRRDFTDVRDVARAYWLAIKKCDTKEVYNISSGKAYLIKDILNRLLGLSAVKIRVQTDRSKLRLSDTLIKSGDPSKFRKTTGWRPQIPLDQTLEETLNWWRGQKRSKE